MAGGRPSKYTKQISDEICARLELGETLANICKSEHMPDQITVIRWKNSKPEFCKRYMRARIEQQHAWADDIVSIAADESRDYYFDTKGERHSDNTSVNRDRLKVDTKKWLMARVASAVYGDKVTTEHTGKDGGPIQYSQLCDRPTVETPEAWQARVSKQIQDKAKATTDTKDTVH